MVFDLYLFCIVLGFFGLISMLVLGAAHGGHGHGHGGSAVHNNGGGAHGSHAGHGHASSTQHGESAPLSAGRQVFLSLLAPRVWFSLLFGFGASGALLHPWLTGLPLGLVAFAGAWVFECGMVQPVWNLVMRFASAPAKTLESTLLEEAVALTNFDAQGQGLISVKLDGQLRQMLGTLRNATGEVGRRVLAGDTLTIVAVDTRRNTCTVARNSPRQEQTS